MYEAIILSNKNHCYSLQQGQKVTAIQQACFEITSKDVAPSIGPRRVLKSSHVEHQEIHYSQAFLTLLTSLGSVQCRQHWLQIGQQLALVTASCSQIHSFKATKNGKRACMHEVRWPRLAKIWSPRPESSKRLAPSCTVSCVRMSCSQHRTLSLQQRLQIGCLTTLCQQKQYNNKTQANEEWPWISVIERLTCCLVWTGVATSNCQCFFYVFVPRDSPMTCKYEQVSLMVRQRSSQTSAVWDMCYRQCT